MIIAFLTSSLVKLYVRSYTSGFPDSVVVTDEEDLESATQFPEQEASDIASELKNVIRTVKSLKFAGKEVPTEFAKYTDIFIICVEQPMVAEEEHNSHVLYEQWRKTHPGLDVEQSFSKASKGRC